MKYERAAAVLLEALYTNDEQATKRHGVSLRSLQRWRRQLATDSELAGFVATKKAAMDARWADELPIALRSCLIFLTGAFDQAATDPRALCNPVMIAAVAGALKICAEVYYTGKVIDARLAEYRQKVRTS